MNAIPPRGPVHTPDDQTRMSGARISPIRVAVVEDNADLREGLTHLLQWTEGFTCVGTYPACEGFLDEIASVAPDVVLMDIGLPGMSGIDGVSELKKRVPVTNVLMLTVFEDDQKILDSICAGASGYLLKLTSPEKILEAIREIVGGGAPLTARVARRLLSSIAGTAPLPQLRVELSDREKQILSGLVDGLSYKMIADRYCISLDTVRTHIRNIYEKLHVHSRSQAITLAMRNRLV
jgi:DNA-binding NarL/FixJ family response regulator